MTRPSKFNRRTILAASAATGLGVLGVAETAEAYPANVNRCSFATWDPITDRSTTVMTPVRVIVHIADVNAADIYGPQKGPGNSYAHFYNPRAGAIRQHQGLKYRSAASLDANVDSISVENEGLGGTQLNANQLTHLAKVFAWCVAYKGVPNRIATVDNTRGLAWHRLGISGNFGAYNPNDRTTWSRAQTGLQWSTVSGKTCPGDPVIRQIKTIYDQAQPWVQRYRSA